MPPAQTHICNNVRLGCHGCLDLDVTWILHGSALALGRCGLGVRWAFLLGVSYSMDGFQVGQKMKMKRKLFYV